MNKEFQGMSQWAQEEQILLGKGLNFILDMKKIKVLVW